MSPAHSKRMIEAARAKSVLVITDNPAGMTRGSMINFVIADKRVRFEISRAAAESAGLKLSSRLLAVALRVHSSGMFVEFSPLAQVHRPAPHGTQMHGKSLAARS
jgi:hypothetical protein